MAREERTLIKQGPNFKAYSDGTILVMGVRLSYPHPFVPQKGDDDDSKPSYSCVGIMPKKSHKAAKDYLVERINELLQDNKDAFKKGEKPQLPPDRKFLKDGDKSGKDVYEDAWIFSCRETKRPAVRDRDKSVLSSEDADRIYGGAWGNLLIRPWFQNHKKFGKRVNANFIALQFLRDDEPFGEGRLGDEDIDETFDDMGGFDADDDDDL